jgi:hypothetical protein
MVILCLVVNSGAPQYQRYVLPVLPFTYVWAGKMGQSLIRKHWITAVAVVSCLAWTVVSSLFVFPHSLSYFNELAGGPRHGHEYFIDSNIDWGQDLLYLKRWLDKHREAKPLHLTYFGSIDPRSAGIEFSLPAKSTARQEPEPGWYAISVSFIRGLPWSVSNGEGGFKYVGKSDYEPFLGLRPVAMAGYSIYIYHVSPVGGGHDG